MTGEKEKPVIWFNTWFSAIYNTITALRKLPIELHIIGTNKSADCTYKDIVDEFYTEFGVRGAKEYVEFALDFCERHSVDIFFPKQYMNLIARHKREFERIGTTVVCENDELLDEFKSKSYIYQLLDSYNYEHIPMYGVANTTDEFLTLYKRYEALGKTVCIKFDADEGASSFRVITTEFNKADTLTEPLMNLVSLDNILSILKGMENNLTFKPLMVMPKLASPEVSVDCYDSEQAGFIAIPRYKLGDRIKEIKLDSKILMDCLWLKNFFRFKAPFNVQYRWEDGEMKLLEINTRISGGVHLSAMSGFSIPNQVVADILRVKLEQRKEHIKPARVTQCETPILL